MLERSQVVPNVYASYYTDGNTDVVKRYNDLYMNNLSPWQQHYAQASIDRKVYLGDQHYLNRYGMGNWQYQKYIFNKAMKLWNVVGGYQRKNRKASRIVPVHNTGSRTASQKTQLIQYAYERDETYNKISDGFDEAGITGLGLLHGYMDYRKDPICGDFRSEVVTADRVMMDAYWTDIGLSDCQFIMSRKYLSRQMVISMLPGREADIMKLNDQAYYDQKFTYMPQQYNIRRKGVMAYDEFWYATERKATFIIDPETYESFQWEGKDEKLEEFRNMFPDVIVTKQNIPTVNLSIIVNGTAMYDGPNPLGIDCYPYVPIVAYHDTANTNYAYRYQGVIRTARDGQYLYNYRKQLELDLLAAQFSGVDVEVDALIDNEDAFKSGPGKARFFKKGRLNALRDVPGANINPANFEATRQLAVDMEQDCGITPELLGMADDTDVGVTTQLRQGAALTTLHKIFDNLDLSQRHFTKLADKIIEKNYTYGKIRRILGEDPSDEFRDRTFQQYDCVVENAPMTQTTRQLAFLQRYQLWKDGFPMPPEEIIEYMEIQDKDKFVEKIKEQQEQQNQMQQSQAQLQMQNQQIVNESLMAKAQSDQAMAAERMAKIKLDQFQGLKQVTEAEAALDRSVLDNMKAVKELQSIDLDHLQSLINIVNSFKMEKEQEMENAEQSQSAGQQAQIGV